MHHECCLSAQGLRDVTKEEGALLCFDEVMTGFRIAKGGAQVYTSAAGAGCLCSSVEIRMIRTAASLGCHSPAV